MPVARPTSRSASPPVRLAWAGVGLLLLLLVGSRSVEATVLSGQVTDAATSVGLGMVDLNFFDSATGEKLPALDADTDLLGFYAIDLPPGTYDLAFRPPRGTRYLGVERFAVVIGATPVVVDVALSQGWLVSGRTVDGLALPVPDVDLDFIETAGDVKIYAPNDDTDAAGAFVVAVASGTYHVEFAAQAGVRLAGHRVESVVVDRDVDLGDVVLEAGWLVSGRVVDAVGAPVAGVDLDVLDPGTGVKAPLGNDDTDPLGNFEIAVLPGTHDLSFEPPDGTRLLPRVVRDVAVAADVDLGDVVLESGWLVRGRVIDEAGTPVVDCDLDVRETLTRQSIPLSGDRTNPAGRFAVAVPAGTHDVVFQPDPELRLLAGIRSSVAVADDVDLGDVVLGAGRHLSGRVVDTGFLPVVGADLDVTDSTSGADVELNGDTTGPDGAFRVVAPDGVLELLVEPLAGLPWRALLVEVIEATGDVDLGELVLEGGWFLSGRTVDGLGRPVAGVDVDVTDVATGLALVLAHDQTDALGGFAVVVPTGTHDLALFPASDTGLAPEAVRELAVAGDTDVGDVVLDGAVVVDGLVVDISGAPVAGVTVEFADPASGVRQPAQGDVTDGSGAYAIAVAPGTWDVRFTPPPGSRLRPAELLAEMLEASRTLPTVRLSATPLLTGTTVDPRDAPIANVSVELRDAGTGAAVPGGVTLSDALGEFVLGADAGTYDVLFVAEPFSGHGVAERLDVVVTDDTSLGRVLLPDAVTARPLDIVPMQGTSLGGTAVTIAGTDFEPGVQAWLGGVAVDALQFVDPTTLTGTTRSRPPGRVDLVVQNPSAPPAVLPGAWAYLRALPDPSLRVLRIDPAGAVRLEWTDVGRPGYEIFRASSPDGFADSGRVTTVVGTSFDDPDASGASGVTYWFVQ